MQDDLLCFVFVPLTLFCLKLSQQCLYCPTAYHVTCIPPQARFHELAVLCHDHAMSHRLPKLDLSSSIQSTLEEKVDQTLMKIHGIRPGSNRRNKGSSFGHGTSLNPFFPGLRGDRFDSIEVKLLRSIKDAATPSQNVTDIDSPPEQASECCVNSLGRRFTVLPSGGYEK
jgi:hypothetical protein